MKTGPGTLTLGGNNAQGGGLIVNAGVVAVNAAQSYGGATTIALEPSRSASPLGRCP